MLNTVEKSLSAKEVTIIYYSDESLELHAGEFPRYDVKLDWVREGEGGNWYRSEEHQMEGWLCPALFKYFAEAPENIYARFEDKST